LISKKVKWYSILLVTFTTLIVSILFIAQQSEDQQNKKHYSYEAIHANNGVIIHVMRSHPQDIQLPSIHKNVADSGFYGINGGFFWLEHLLSIAVENDVPSQGAAEEYGSGWYNVKYPRGTLVYDQASKQLTVQVVSSVDELKVTDRSHYWAQGGVSMNLSDPVYWEDVMNIEVLPFADDTRLRSGIVYDQDGFVYLIVSTTQCTASQFRSAIMELEYPLIDGIFLDGDGSSQMLTDEISIPGDGRKITQMIRIKSQ
jgi:uncharacterized protein YigE (DUF2233 family)